MVNSISYSTGGVPDTGPKVATGATGSSASYAPPAHTEMADASAPSPPPVAVKAPAQPLVQSLPLVPNLTSLALYKDPESGMQVSVVRDRVSGQVVEQVPTERVRRLAAMVRQQEIVAQELHQDSAGTPRLDLQT